MARPDDFRPIAVTSRSGLDESVHFGAVVALSSSGHIEAAVGDPDALVYPRSANKPMQALAMVRAGLDLPGELLALVCASHDGTPAHLAGVRRILAGAGLTPDALANTAALPLDEASAHQVIRDGGGPTALQMNCSGKHSGMLATCVHNGWSTDAHYLSVEHPLQQAITATISELSELSALSEHGAPHIGIDGCGAPVHAMPLVGLARAFRSIASGQAGAAGAAVYAAMTGHPNVVGGERRDVSQLMRGMPGLLAKDGADGVFAAALPDGRAVALKIADGGDRARAAVLLAALRTIGVDVTAVAPQLEVAIMGHGQPVGTVRAIWP